MKIKEIHVRRVATMDLVDEVKINFDTDKGNFCFIFPKMAWLDFLRTMNFLQREAK